MKKIYIVLFCLLFLMIPTYIAISYLIKGNSSPVVLQNLKTITLVSPNSAEYTFDYSENDPDSVVMYSLFSDKKGVKSIPDNVLKIRPFEITYISDLYNTKVKGYFSEDPSNCYLEYRSGVKVTYYRVHTEAATAFLDSEYSEGVYSHATIPSLVVAGKNISPVSADWNYITYSGNEKKAKEITVGGGAISSIGSVSSDFVCQFDVVPDDVKITITRDDTSEVIYTGGVSGISGVDAKDNHDVTITIDAVWNKSEEKKYNGNVKYTVKARLHRPPYFFLSEPQIKSGEFVVLSAKNVINIDELKLTCEPEINYTPKFFKDGDYYRAIVPISIDLGSERRTYKFTLEINDTVSNLELLVLERSDDYKKIYNVSKATLDSLGVTPNTTESKFNPYPGLYQSIKPSIEGATDFSTEYFSGKFDYGYSKGVMRASFGDHISYSAWSDKEMCRGYDYFYAGNSKNDPVTAVNRGKVVYIGQREYTGQLVVIDHGYGLLSWYYNLGNLGDGLAVGQIVERGAIIGYNGGGGLAEVIGAPISVHIAFTVFDVPVDISPLTTEGVIIHDN